MKTNDWLAFFRKNSDIKIFHTNHLKVLSGANEKTLGIGLSRLTKRKVIQRICRNYYANPFNQPTLYEISAQIHQPNYISLESALNLHGILSQIPQLLTCVTTNLPYKLKTTFGIIEYRQVQKNFFFGFLKKNGYYLAEAEKAFLDYIYLNQSRLSKNFSELGEWDLSLIKVSKLKKYAKKMNITLPGKLVNRLKSFVIPAKAGIYKIRTRSRLSSG